MKRNAIILVAGKSSRFAPFTYEKPKGLFRVRGEILIERQIEQLKEAGVEDIYVVVGYMKEKFFYLEDKYNVKLIVNNAFGKKGNLYSLFVARQYLHNTFVCCGDHYFMNNPFLDENPWNLSYRACSYQKGKFREFAIDSSEANVITEVRVGGKDSWAMVGHAYFNESFSSRFVKLMENEIDDFGVAQLFWEEYYGSHIKELTLYRKDFEFSEISEFDSIDDLREFDSEFLLNVDSDIISNICDTLSCHPNEIKNISIINAGLTNVSFAFSIKDTKYVYRHPGGTAGNLINRQTELFTQKVAKEIGIDQSYIHMDLSGWKVSYYVEDAQNCDFEKYEDQLNTAMAYLHSLHKVKTDDTVKIFDNVAEGMKLLRIASATKGNLEKEFADIISKVERLYEYVKQDAKALGYELVLCHNDVYEPNYLYNSKNEIYLIDWEYAGLNYEPNDICCILARYDWSTEQIERYLRAYVGRELTEDENRLYHAFIPITGFYWFCWGLYKGSVGDDDSFFFLPSYRNIMRYLDPALAYYE
ncbi:MAG: NTP transferase domain-containing protein [Bacillota bacterium]|nr:NTP transferase domain-containing protein [Bacillota bacterium]